MDEQPNGPREIPIKISVSVEQPETKTVSEESGEKSQEPAGLKDGTLLHQQCNIVFAPAERQTEHGLTKIQVVQFADPDQRQKVLRLFNNPTLYRKLPQLYSYFRELKNGEQLYYAAVAVSELADVIPFVDLKGGILSPWAKSEDGRQREAAALALRYTADHDTLQPEALSLLKYWLTIDSPTFNKTALRAYQLIGPVHPDATLIAIREAVIAKSRMLTRQAQSILDVFNQVSAAVQVWQLIEQVVFIVDKIYSLYPYKLVKHLHSWLIGDSSQQKAELELLRYIAAMLFTIVVRLEDFVFGEEESKDTYKQLVDITFTLWEDSSLPMHDEVYNDTTELVKSWAEQALRMCTENKDKETCKAYKQFFHRLYQRYENKRRNRLVANLQRWQRFREMERQRSQRKMEMARRRAEKLGRALPQDNIDLRGDFLDLIPAG